METQPAVYTEVQGNPQEEQHGNSLNRGAAVVFKFRGSVYGFGDERHTSQQSVFENLGIMSQMLIQGPEAYGVRKHHQGSVFELHACTFLHTLGLVEEARSWSEAIYKIHMDGDTAIFEEFELLENNELIEVPISVQASMMDLTKIIGKHLQRKGKEPQSKDECLEIAKAFYKDMLGTASLAPSVALRMESHSRYLEKAYAIVERFFVSCQRGQLMLV